LAQSIENPAEKRFPNSDSESISSRPYESPRSDAAQFAKGHEQGSISFESDYFTLNVSVRLDDAYVADFGIWPIGLDDESDHLRNPADYLHQRT
jgi:hypothetical protein